MVVRVLGVNLPSNKHICIALRHVYGVGPTRALVVCKAAGVDSACKVSALSENEIARIRSAFESSDYVLEGDLRREISVNIKRKMDIGCYEGIRHKRGLPLKKNTKNNARTRKGRRKN